MSSSRGGSGRGDRGKGIAQDQSTTRPSKSRRPSRRDVMEEVSRLAAERLQMEEDNRTAMLLSEMQQDGGRGGGSQQDDEYNVAISSDSDNNEDRSHSRIPSSTGGNEDMPPPPPANPAKALKSDIFVKHFKKVPVVIPSSNDPNSQEETSDFQVYCNYCNKVYKWSAGGGYGTFRRHLLAKHPVECGNTSTQSQLNFQPAGSGSSGTPLFKFEKKNFDDTMTRWAAMKHLPFNVFDDRKFEVTMQSGLNVAIKRIGRMTVQRSTVRQCLEKKVELSRYLLNLGHKVNICSDVWTDCFNRHSYMGITVHFVDNSWSLNKRLIGFREFETPHTAPEIASLIIQVLNEFQLCNKIFSVAFDNATANTASIGDLIAACQPVIGGKYFHQRCICHILNLCVQDALELWQKHVSPIRNAVRLIHCKPPIGKAWKKYCHQKNVRYTNFTMDVSHRWNSTYDCLNSTLKHKDALCDFFRTHPVHDLYLSHSCWEQSLALFNVFKAFKNATVELSGVYYCTAVRVLEHCMYISLGFNVAMKKASSSPELMCVIYYMIEKWLKYFSEIPAVFLIAKVLDPKWKLVGTSRILDFYYNNFNSIDLAPLQAMQSDTSAEFGVDLSETFQINLPDRSIIQHAFEFNLRSLYAEYETRYNNTHQVRRPPPPAQHNYGFAFQADYDDPDAQSQLADLYNYSTGGRSSSTVSEMDLYFDSLFSFGDEGPTPPAQIDVLDWWGTHEKDFPILASMAKEIFSVPASTVAVESAFSVSSRVLDESRSQLSAKNMEAVMLLDDWAKADVREQENDWDNRQEGSQDEFTGDES